MINKKNKHIILAIAFFFITILYSIHMIQSSYAYSSIYYRDDGYIELNADDLENLTEEEYNKVVKVTLRTFFPSQNNIEILKKLDNLEEIIFMGVDVKDISFINELKSNNIKLYSITSTVDLNNISNQNITFISLAGSSVKNIKSIEALENLETINIGETSGYETLDYTKFPKLKSLVLTSYVEDFETLINSIPNVTELSLASTNIQNKDTQYLKKLPNLKSLNLNQTYITDIDFLNDLPNIEQLTLPWSITDLSPIYNLNNLQSLTWDAYTELNIDQELVNYLDSKNIWHYDYDPSLKNKINNILNEIEINDNDTTKYKLEKIVRYIVNNTGTDLSNQHGNNSALSLLINQNMGVCYHHSSAVYTLAKMAGIDDIYAVDGSFDKLVNLYTGRQPEDEFDHNNLFAHAWNIVNLDGIWYGIDAAQMNEGLYYVDELYFEANFFKNPLKDDDYDYNYAQENFYDFNYYFVARHDENDGILKQTQTFQFKDINNLNIINHIIYDFDKNDINATNLCNKVLDNYDCIYIDTDNNNEISTGDKINIIKKDVIIETFTLNLSSYIEPKFEHLGKVELEYENYKDEDASYILYDNYFNSTNPLLLKLKGEDYQNNKNYNIKIEIIDFEKDEIIFTDNITKTGEEINNGTSYQLKSEKITPAKESNCNEFMCFPNYIINIYENDKMRDAIIQYLEHEKINYTITIQNNTYLTKTYNTFSIEENSSTNIEITPKDGYQIKSIKINDIENINNYKNNILSIKNINENLNIIIETEPKTYEFIEGNDAIISNNKIKFKINGPAELFIGLLINDKTVDPNNYSIESGSTIIILTEEYAKSLKPGTYIVKALYSNGTSDTTTFTKKKSIIEQIINPTTQDNVIKYFIVLFVSTIGLIYLIVYKKDLV